MSHETKVPVLAANQVDMTISPLSETPGAPQVIDFVLYSATSLCMFGRADDPQGRAAPRRIDDLNKAGVIVAYYIGGGEEHWVKTRFPKATLRGVSTAGTAAPVEEIMGEARRRRRRSTAFPGSPINKKVKGLEGAAGGQQLPGQQGNGHRHRLGHRQEPAGVLGVAESGRDAHTAGTDR